MVRTASFTFILFSSFLQPVIAQDANTLSSDATLTVTTGKVEAGTFTRFLTINGTINAWQEVVIAPEVGGYRVEAVLVDVGDYVQAGQQLVKLSTALLATEYSSKQAALKQRQAESVNADLALQRAQELAAKSLLSQADLDRLNSEALGATARLDGARAELAAAQVKLDFANVIAPDAGVITQRSVTVGQLAQAGSEMLRLLR